MLGKDDEEFAAEFTGVGRMFIPLLVFFWVLIPLLLYGYIVGRAGLGLESQNLVWMEVTREKFLPNL